MSSDDDHREQLELGDDEYAMALKRGWDRALRALATKLNKRNIDNFLRPLKPLSYDGEIVVLGAPSAFAREWADKKYASMIRETLDQHLDLRRQGSKLQVRLVISKPEVQPVLGDKPDELKIEAAPDPEAAREFEKKQAHPAVVTADLRNPFLAELLNTTLNDKYTFESYVVGKSNRLAEAGAKAVAESPGRIYNPLFIYGSPGLGKTHLMHAIGHAVRRNLPTARVACISGEMFTNHYVASLRDKRTEEFRKAYRSVDVWLVDDIQTIASKEQTREEFFHTFNTLHQMNKQIVITCDRSPRELRSMDERIRSRFECGLIADIAPPDFDMRSEILQQKAARENMPIPREVVEYMANLIQSNIRALEGALIKLIAYASLVRSPVTKQLAGDVLSGYFVGTFPANRGEVSPAGATADQIIDTVAVQLGIDREMILAPGNRRKDVAFARQVAMYLCKEMSKSPMSTLAQSFGCRNHSAIAHAHSRLEGVLGDDPKLMATVANIRRVIEYSL